MRTYFKATFNVVVYITEGIKLLNGQHVELGSQDSSASS